MPIEWDKKGHEAFSETDSFYCTKTAPACSIKASGARLMSSNRCLAQSHSDADLRISQMYVFISCLRILIYIPEEYSTLEFYLLTLGVI